MSAVPVRPPPSPSVRIDLAAFTLLAVGLLVAVSCSAPIRRMRPALAREAAATGNLLGPGGAWIAQRIDRRPRGGRVRPDRRLVRARRLAVPAEQLVDLVGRGLLGWLVLVPCAAVLADWIGPAILGGPLTGSGGALGRGWPTGWRSNWPHCRGRLRVGACVGIGLVLALDRLVLGHRSRTSATPAAGVRLVACDGLPMRATRRAGGAPSPRSLAAGV